MDKKIKANAIISYAYSLGTNEINNFSETNTIDVELRYVELKIKKTSSTYFYKPGDVLHYSIVVSNLGNYYAEDVIVVDGFKSLKYVDGSCSVLVGHNQAEVLAPNIEEENIVFEVGRIEPQSSIVINYAAIAKSEIGNNEDLTNTATIYAKRLNPVYSNIICIEQKYANIISKKYASREYVYNYDDLDLTITLVNTGNIPAYNLQIVETLPKGFALMSKEDAITIANQPYHNYEYNPETNLLKINLEEIKPEDGEIAITLSGRIFIAN